MLHIERIWRGTAQGGMEDLGINIYPMAINNAGQIAGTTQTRDARWTEK